jgi:hypothetical protein
VIHFLFQNQGYVNNEDNETRASLRQPYDIDISIDDTMTSGSARELPVGEEVIEPIIVRATAAESSTIFDHTRRSHQRKYSPDGELDMSKYVAGFGDVYHENELWRQEGDGHRAGSRASPVPRPHSSQSRHSRAATPLGGGTTGDDGFPWTPPKRTSYTSADLDTISVTMHHDMRRGSRQSTAEEEAKKIKRFLWWRRIVKTLQDNRVETQDAMRKMILLEKKQDKHFRRLKKILNMIFLVSGLLLLLAIIVLIIYTDPQFEESMKALTVFLAGRRQGIW